MMIVESMIRNEITEDIKKIYFYRLIKNRISLSLGDGRMDVQSYGIEIERQDVVNGSIINIERDSVKSISPHRHKVHNLLKFLYDNCVSPIHLIDVLGDYIDEYIVDFDEALKEIATY
ncbi:hypothetical protein HMPREF1982_00969 [Clostridiales bacterium oral taxon 876 str. F0540]|nr:hypothetical protein HMPREF1982_00969 [Clostridiales bacterium oral taxon 876 str. F0540]